MASPKSTCTYAVSYTVRFLAPTWDCSPSHSYSLKPHFCGFHFVANMASGNNSSCFEFSQEQLNQVTAAVVSVSALAIIACALAVILIIVLKLYRKFLNRLVLYLMVAAGGYSVAFILAITPVHHSNGVQVREGLDGLCAAFGFFNQMTEWIFHGTMTWVIVYLTLMALFKYQADKPKHEVSVLIIILLFPFIINWIPFIKEMYGISGIWCWIKLTNGDCHSDHTLGVVYHFTLYYGPFAIFVFGSYVAFIAIVATLCKERVASGRERAESFKKETHRQALKEALPLLAYPLIYNIFFTIMLANRVYHAIAASKNEDPNFPLFLVHAVVESLRVLLAALAFLLHPNILKKVFCKKQATEFTATDFYVSAEFPGDDSLVIIGSQNTTARDISKFHSIFARENTQAQ